MLIATTTYAQNNVVKNYIQYLKDISVKPSEKILFVSIENQILYEINKNQIIRTYDISSSKYGFGNKENSNKTPIGLHLIKKKFGDKVPIYGKFIGRKFYGKIATIFTDATKSETDDITSRILWLEGLEENINKGDGIDSYKRYIYIHGTSEEGLIGRPASHGCIRMKNKDIIELYDKIKIGTLVLIL